MCQNNKFLSSVFAVYSLVFVLILYAICVELGKFYDFNEHLCNITRVDYPVTMPVYGDDDGWVPCNCGKRCLSLTPCINMYATIDPEKRIKNDYYKKLPCTINEETCSHGEDPRYIAESLNKSIEIAESYINSTVPCYYNDNIDEIYLFKNPNYTLMIMAVLLGFIWLNCCLVWLVNLQLSKKIKCKKDKKKVVENDDRFENVYNIENISYKV